MSNILITPHFTMYELTESPTARRNGIDNTPSAEEVDNLRRLCTNTLEPLRMALGMPVIITSGYRCKELNNLVSHHSSSSQHLKGQAADFYIGWGQPLGGRGQAGDSVLSQRERLTKAFHIILTDDLIDFDQLILYPTFIHVSYASPRLNRHYIMTAAANGHYKRITREDALKIQ